MKIARLITKRRLKWMGVITSVVLLAATVVSAWFTVTMERSESFPVAGGSFGNGIQTWSTTFVLLDRSRVTLILRWPPRRDEPDVTTIHTWRVENHSLLSPSDVKGPMALWLDWHFESWNPTRSVSIPLWMLLLTVVGPTTWLWRTDRRVEPGNCQNCGYDLAGLRGDGGEEVDSETRRTVCPECGQETCTGQ